MKFKTSEYQGILIGLMIVGIISGLLLLLTDFAGWYHGSYHYEEWGYIYFGSGIFTSLVLFVMTLLMFRSAYGAMKIIKVEKVDFGVLKSQAMESQRGGMAVAVISFASGLLFAVSNIIEETGEGWLDVGFFAGVIGGVMLVFLARLILAKME